MKKVHLLLFLLLFVFTITIVFVAVNVNAGRGCCSHHQGQKYCGSDGYWYCNDGTRSPTCTCGGSSYSNNETNSNNNYIPAYQKPDIYGCTDVNAYNYNANATKNDGSCIAKVYGCTNVNAYNYNENANIDDNSCIEKKYGCIYVEAVNFNEEANTNDGSCLYKSKKKVIKRIKYKTIKKYKFFRKEGTVLKKGKKGKKQITYEYIKNENNEIVEKKIINTKILEYPTNKVVSTRKKFYQK